MCQPAVMVCASAMPPYLSHVSLMPVNCRRKTYAIGRAFPILAFCPNGCAWYFPSLTLRTATVSLILSPISSGIYRETSGSCQTAYTRIHAGFDRTQLGEAEDRKIKGSEPAP